MTSRKVFLLRHAKSDWDDPKADDHDRTLNARGRRSAGEVGQTIIGERLAIDVALVSTARRAVETAELAQLDKVQLAAELYDASAGDLLAQLQALSADVISVLVVGHNPGMENVAGILARRQDVDQVSNGMSTATLLAFEVELDEWTDLEPGSARVSGRWEHRGEKKNR